MWSFRNEIRIVSVWHILCIIWGIYTLLAVACHILECSLLECNAVHSWYDVCVGEREFACVCARCVEECTHLTRSHTTILTWQHENHFSIRKHIVYEWRASTISIPSFPITFIERRAHACFYVLGNYQMNAHTQSSTRTRDTLLHHHICNAIDRSRRVSCVCVTRGRCSGAIVTEQSAMNDRRTPPGARRPFKRAGCLVALGCGARARGAGMSYCLSARPSARSHKASNVH